MVVSGSIRDYQVCGILCTTTTLSIPPPSPLQLNAVIKFPLHKIWTARARPGPSVGVFHKLQLLTVVGSLSLSPVRADDDLAAVPLTLHLNAEPLPVFDLGRDRRVQRHGGAVVHAVALVPAHRTEPVRRDLGAVLQ